MLKRVISYIRTLTLYPAARTIVTTQSALQRWKTLGQKPKVHFEAPYDGRKIMLLALYQKGELRSDVLRLIKVAREEGLYVLAVNTLKLRNPDELAGVVDCYIERPNFGRDFGSYKTGFLHVFNRGWHSQCPRLLMVNDSVFFTEERLPKFISDMMTSNIEVLGSTENYEIEYHLGSFCIAMAQSVIGNESFQRYWSKYRLTDVRPRVIRHGEMKLSKILKKAISGPNQIGALYGAERFYQESKRNFDLLKFSIENARRCAETPAKRLNAKAILDYIDGNFLHDVYSTKDVEVSVDTSLDKVTAKVFVSRIDDIRDLIDAQLAEFSTVDASKLDQAIHSAASELFMRHSQIHQNSAILIYMGLPIVKLDLVYRGMANIIDLDNITRQLKPIEDRELSKILLARPYGEHVLFGWRRAAFMSGLI